MLGVFGSDLALRAPLPQRVTSVIHHRTPEASRQCPVVRKASSLGTAMTAIVALIAWDEITGLESLRTLTLLNHRRLQHMADSSPEPPLLLSGFIEIQ